MRARRLSGVALKDDARIELIIDKFVWTSAYGLFRSHLDARGFKIFL